MRKAFTWIGIVLLSPILIFILLTLLLYLPPIQKFAVDKGTTIASEATGMQISVDRLGLSFPLDLCIEGVCVRQEADTIADIGRVVADVRLLPLIGLKVVVNEVAIEQAKVNTLSMIPDLQVSGSVERLWLRSDGIDLGEGMVALNGTQLTGAELDIQLGDTAAVDTTTSAPLPWRIDIDSITISRSHIMLHMPGDTMQVGVGIDYARAEEGVVDLLNSRYTVRQLVWQGGAVTYDQNFEPIVPEGLDYNHIALSGMRLAIDSIYFCAPNLALKISDAALQERSGLTLSQMRGIVLMDSAGLRMPNMLLATPYSNIRARADVDFNLMDSVAPGNLHLNLDAALGKQDLLLFMADMPAAFRSRWPEWPLTIKAQADGNMEHMEIAELEATLPTAFHAKAHGKASQLMDLDHLLAQLDLEAETYDLGFATTLADADMMKDYRIPNGIKMNALATIDGQRYQADAVIREGKGYVKAKAWFAQSTMSYDANVVVDNINIHHFMPHDSLFEVTAWMKARGQGLDFLKRSCWVEADASLQHLRYTHMDVDSLTLKARLNDGHALATLKGRNDLFHGSIDVDALINHLMNRDNTLLKDGTQHIEAAINADLHQLDLYALGLTEDPLQVGLCGHLDVESNLDSRHHLSGLIDDIYLRDSLNMYRPEKIGLLLSAEADTTMLRMQSGDLIVKADASGSYDSLLTKVTQLADTMMAQYHSRTIDQMALKRLLPTARLYIVSGQENPVAAFLRSTANTYFKTLDIDLTTSAAKGANGSLNILGLNADSTRIDTIRMNLIESKHGLTFRGQVTNNRRNPQFVFNALIDGHLHEHGLTAGFRFFDDRNELGLRLGAKASMEQNGIRVNLVPEKPTIGYRVFTLNKDNFLFLGNDLKLQTKVDLLADDGTGVKIYSENQDSTMLQDLTVSLYRFDLDKLTTAIPYVPHVTGILDGDFHLMMDEQEKISVSSDMQVASMTYEDSPIGNVSTEFIYMQREDDTHALQATMMLDNKEVLGLNGSYQNKDQGYLDATLSLLHTPMNIVNGFVPDHLVGLEGFAEGELSVKGPTNKPIVNGEVYLADASLISQPYGMKLRFDDDPVRINDSKLMLDNFTMYSYNDNPLNISGDIDFSDLDRIMMNVRMRARNFQLINSKQTKESVAYGKAFVNFFAYMNGRLDQLKMRGKLDVLGTTDLTYILLDSPISTGNEIEELVKFTDFADSTLTVVEKPTPQGLDVDISINIDEGTHVRCDLNAEQSNYVDILGGGEMRMKYSNDGITMTGRYTVNNGQMKYSLPVIPLKTFTIQDGSYVEFRGEMMNPRLNITATERTKAPVTQEGGQSRSVAFDCGVVITKTLNDMGLEFIINAPEDMTISSELNAMTKEQRGKLAVTMLTTGMYLADGNTSAFTMNSALNSFLQSEINNITGSALKTVDVSVGMDQSTTSTGTTRTDYSFKFAKRFWNNRLNVQIGGKVSTGAEMQEDKQSFFDQVAMEYRLTPTSNQYVKLFYNQNVYDWLEGYTGQYGAGYIWKRKLSNIWEVFKLWGNSQNNAALPATNVRKQQRDSNATEKTDSVNVKTSTK